MKTKFGKFILKRNSKIMDKLNKELLQLSTNLITSEDIRAEDFYAFHWPHIRTRMRENRDDWDALQKEINDICLLESRIEE